MISVKAVVPPPEPKPVSQIDVGINNVNNRISVADARDLLQKLTRELNALSKPKNGKQEVILTLDEVETMQLLNSGFNREQRYSTAMLRAARATFVFIQPDGSKDLHQFTGQVCLTISDDKCGLGPFGLRY